MCAINPKHRKRIIFDFYTSDPQMTKEAFDKGTLEWASEAEWNLNAHGAYRVHVKETEQEAD